MSLSEEPAGRELPLSAKQAIDRVCLDFEDRFRAGATPGIESYLGKFDGRQRAVLLRELLLVELSYLRGRGEQPTRKEYALRFPDDTGILATVILPAAVDRAPIYEADKQIGLYRIERLLGCGAFGEVYLATDTRRQRQVAIKVLAGNRFTSPDAVEHFLEEARTVRKLEHPAIVRAWDVLRDDDGRPLIVMQFIDGQSLRQRLNGSRLPRIDAIQWLAQIAEAIDYAHRQGIVHRDLEPRNILLDRQGRPYVSDFGLAVDEQTQDTRAGESAGSLAYMSPEQVRGESHWLDGRADIWALGVILYEMMSGRRPFTAREADQLADQILYREAKPLRQIDGEIPAELERICLRCLKKAVADRYATAKDLADDLRRVRLLADGTGKTNAAANVPRFGPFLALTATAAENNSSFAALLGTLLAAVVLGVLTLGLGGRMSWRGDPPRAESKSDAGLHPNSHVQAANSDDAVSGLVVEDIVIGVWVPHGKVDQRRGQINKLDSTAAPLRIGDKIRLSVSVSEPSFVYVLWLDPDGQLLPIYPWKDGRWQSRPNDEQQLARLDLPSSLSTWTIEAGAAGAATLFVFAGRERFSPETNLASLLPECNPQIGQPTQQVFWFENGQEVRPTGRKTRHPVQAPADW